MLGMRLNLNESEKRGCRSFHMELRPNLIKGVMSTPIGKNLTS